jgi:hypothetical protein
MPGALVAIEHANGVQREPPFLLSEANQFVFPRKWWGGLGIIKKHPHSDLSGFNIQFALGAVHDIGWLQGTLGVAGGLLLGQFPNGLLISLGRFGFGLSGCFRGLLGRIFH